MEQAKAAGFIPVIAPALVKPETMEGTGFLGAHASEVYKLADDDLYLVGTSEVALAGYHSDEILADLPLRYAGFSSCFRREAGSYGKDTKGIIRVHWFDKVEMFSYVAVDDAADEHQRLLAWEREFIDKLELAYRVIDVAAGDLGSSAARKFDIEAWFPSQGAYRELTSTSNCTTFQSRRLNIRTRDRDGHRAGGHAERHAVRDRAHHRLPARPPPAARRLGVRAEGAASLARRPRGARRAVTRRRCSAPISTAPCCAPTAPCPTARGPRCSGPRPRGCSSRSPPAVHRGGCYEVAEATGHTGVAVAANGAVLFDLATDTVIAEHLLSVELLSRGDRGPARAVPADRVRHRVRRQLPTDGDRTDHVRRRTGLPPRLGGQPGPRPRRQRAAAAARRRPRRRSSASPG